jgi:hypothetical protein
MLRRPFRCTHPSSTTAFQRKDTKEPISWQVLGIFTALQLPSRPVHRWRAWLSSFGSFGAKSLSTFFLASWANTRRGNRIVFFSKIVLGKYWVLLGHEAQMWETEPGPGEQGLHSKEAKKRRACQRRSAGAVGVLAGPVQRRQGAVGIFVAVRRG